MAPVVTRLEDRRFGKFLVVSEAGRDKWGQALWLCKCDCGNERTVTGGNLRHRGDNQSCGCGKAERFRKTYTTHGQSQTTEYRKQQDFLKRFRKYGITPEEFDAMKNKQEFRCAICGVVPDSKNSRARDGFSIDHCHVSGRVRGLLCLNCNTGIGMLKESEEILKAAIKYLQNNK